MPTWKPIRTAAPVLLAMVVAALASGGASADVIVGGSGDDNTYPFGKTDLYIGEYQQLYNAGAFPGTATITSVGFESVKLIATGPETLTFSLSLSTSPSSIGNPSHDFAANKGADFTTVFDSSITFTGQNNGTFDLVVPTTPFTYNPAAGNLLVDVVIKSSSGSGLASFNFGPSNDVSRVYWIGGDPRSGATSVGVHEGLLTRFTLTSAASVPEPGVLAECGVAGVLALLGLRRRFRKG